MGSQILIRLAEWPAAEESSVRREWRWVGCCEDQMLLSIHLESLLLRIASPKDENHMLAMLVHRMHYGICETLPPFLLMGSSFSGTHSQGCVEKEHSLICPV